MHGCSQQSCMLSAFQQGVWSMPMAGADSPPLPGAGVPGGHFSGSLKRCCRHTKRRGDLSGKEGGRGPRWQWLRGGQGEGSISHCVKSTSETVQSWTCSRNINCSTFSKYTPHTTPHYTTHHHTTHHHTTHFSTLHHITPHTTQHFNYIHHTLKRE